MSICMNCIDMFFHSNNVTKQLIIENNIFTELSKSPQIPAGTGTAEMWSLLNSLFLSIQTLSSRRPVYWQWIEIIHRLTEGSRDPTSVLSQSFLYSPWSLESVSSLNDGIEQQGVGSNVWPCCAEPPSDCGTCWNLGGQVVRPLQQWHLFQRR